MTGWPPTTPTLFWDYVSDTDPTITEQVEAGEKWFDTANAEGYVYNGTGWDGLSVAEYAELSGTIPQPDIADDTIITRMVAANAITNTEMADNSVNTAEIVADAVTTALIAADAVDSEQIVNDAITGALIATGAIGADQHGDAVSAPTYAGTGNFPALSVGELVFNTNDNKLYVEDGT